MASTADWICVHGVPVQRTGPKSSPSHFQTVLMSHDEKVGRLGAQEVGGGMRWSRKSS